MRPSATTLDYSIVPKECPSNKGQLEDYFQLTYGPGYPCITRYDLVKHCGEKSKKKKHLATFVQITDIHIIDASSPARASFLSVFVREIPALSDAFRAYEAFSCQVADQMVKRINAVAKGPHLKQPIGLVINTGDSADGEQVNELTNYINLLDGGKVIPNTATPGEYVGVQDNVSNRLYPAYYHPDSPPADELPDIYKILYGYPEFPDILNAAAKPFYAEGLKFPWYAVNGNHDVTKLGNYSLGFFKIFTLFDQLATGTLPQGLCSQLIESMTPFQAKAFVAALVEQKAEASLQVIKKSNLREIPDSEDRKQFSPADFVRAHINTSLKPGPIGHGYTEENVETNTLYYKFSVSKDVLGISLDTCNWSGNLENFDKAPNGGIGRWQIAWLESELRKVHSCYYNDLGQKIYTKNENRLVMIFCHHTIETLNNDFNSSTTFDPDPQKILGCEFVEVLHRYPNVIALVNGHEHRNKITPFPNPHCRGGFWEINTASHIDYPQQSRIIEVAENCDKTLSIFCTLIDHLSVPDSEKAVFPEPSSNSCSTDNSCTDTYTDTRSDTSADTDTHTTDTHTTDTNDSYTQSETRSYRSCCQKYTREEIASVSRELSYNDPFIVDKFDDGENRLGTFEDRNVELLLPHPFRC